MSKNAFKITFGDGILACMSRDFGIFMPKHLAVQWLLNNYIYCFPDSEKTLIIRCWHSYIRQRKKMVVVSHLFSLHFSYCGPINFSSTCAAVILRSPSGSLILLEDHWKRSTLFTYALLAIHRLYLPAASE